MNPNMKSESRFLTKSKCVRSLKMKPCVTWAEMTCGDLLQLCRTAVVRRKVCARSWVAKMCWQASCHPNSAVLSLPEICPLSQAIFSLFFFRVLKEYYLRPPPPSAALRYCDHFLFAEKKSYCVFKCPMLIGQSSG